MVGKLALKSLEHVWLALEPLQIPRAVMGGIALSAWEYVRSTLDVDFLIGIDATDPDQVLKTLQDAGLRPKHHPAIIVVGPARFMQLVYEVPGTYTDVVVDLLFAEQPYQREALARRLPIRFEGMNQDVFVLSCEDLILFKLVAGRVRDRADVIALLEANRSRLDFQYLNKWIPQLSVASGWAEAWQAAFPGEPLPGE